ncbi:uncharacterized protein LOC124161111 [Ischnura elegans]|uniref:uncharacterized protein LOC124161111 n=1 Tax=Ischnura elegans TaxID=197161 RepID=UPI001ED88757|nr:uncharacterized protein LOC124161111 [Ischnura elegans]XP_046393276.1 uncharacterized protein LOC124161111 [Ischnura elegans]
MYSRFLIWNFTFFTVFHLINATYFELLMNDTDLKNYDAQDLLNELKTELDLHDARTVSVKPYSILIPPDTVLELCFKDTHLLQTLSSYESNCTSEILDFKCRLGELVVHGKHPQMDELNDTVSKSEKPDLPIKTFQSRINDCSELWSLLVQVNPEADARQEIGQCLQHTFSVTCHKFLQDKIKGALV